MRVFLKIVLSTFLLIGSIVPSVTFAQEQTSETFRKIVKTNVILSTEKIRALELIYSIDFSEVELPPFFYNIEVPESFNIQSFLKEEFVVYIEDDIPVQIQAEVIDWGITHIHADDVWPTSTGSGVRIAVLDTGVDIDHEDIRFNLLAGYDFVNNDTNPSDDNGHGTHVTGIIIAQQNNIGLRGVAYQSEIIPVKVLDENGDGFLSDIIAGINYAIEQDVDIINMSFGTLEEVESLHDAIKLAHNAGIILIGAAGNENGDDCFYPGAYPEVICVVAIDEQNEILSFSSTKGDISAPGDSIYSTYLDGTYRRFSGTSMATPFVSGTAALLKSVCAQCSVSEIRDAIVTTATDLGESGFDTIYGNGLINAQRSLDYVKSLYRTSQTLFINDTVLERFRIFLSTIRVDYL